MGLRTTTAKVGSSNAADMAPALTEPVSQPKISSSSSANASPRPEILANNTNQEFLCPSTKQQSVQQIVICNNSISKVTFEQESVFGAELSNGPKNGPLAKSHMDQPSDLNEFTTSKDQHNDNLSNIDEFVEIHQPPVELVTASTSLQIAEQQLPPATVSNSTMGLQKDYLKENAEMEQMLGELASSGEIDLMQVFKSFESVPASDNLCELAGGLSLFNDVDVMNMGLEYVSTPSKDTETLDIRNEIEKRKVQMIRKCDFLVRRLRKIQARYMGQHVNEDVNSLFDYTQQLVKRKDRGSKSISTMTPVNLLNSDKQKDLPSCSMKNLIKRIDQSASTCQQSSMKNRVGRPSKSALAEALSGVSPTSIGPGQSIGGNVIPIFDPESKQQLESSSGLMQAAMKKVNNAIDSDATASSSGGESADEMITYNNPTQNSMSMKEDSQENSNQVKNLMKKRMKRAKRAAWRWARDRSGIAARCSWLLSQISDLEYRVRQHSELHHQIRKNKGPIKFEDGCNVASNQEPPPQSSVNGYRGMLPGNTKSSDIDISPNGVFDAEPTHHGSCRTRAFQRNSFKKRKLTQMTNLHTVSKKAAKPSTVKCGCQWPLLPCALCTGRTDPTAPRELPDTLSFGECVGLLDPAFHPVISFKEDVSQSIHFECTMRRPEWQTKASRSNAKTVLKGAIALQKEVEREDERSKHLNDTNLPRKYKKKYNILASSKLKKKAKKSKTNRHNSHMLNNKHRKKSLNSTASDLETFLGEGAGDNTTTANGAILPRSKTTSPTPCNSKQDKLTYYTERKNKNSYDIDNIVIPYSVAASTRIEVLKCKEIPTPKWRLVDEETVSQIEIPSQDKTKVDVKEDVEDITADTLFARHERALADERKKFSTYLKFPWSTRSRANRRIDSRADSSGTNTPDRTSPAPKTPGVGPVAATAAGATGEHESISSPAIASTVAPPTPQTPQTPLELTEIGTEVIATATSTSITVPTEASISAATTPITSVATTSTSTVNTINALIGNKNSFNGSKPLPAVLKSERRRTVSMKKNADLRDDALRLSIPTDHREAVQPFDALEFPLSDDLYDAMLKMFPSIESIVNDEQFGDVVNKSTTTVNDTSEQDNSKSGGGNNLSTYLNDTYGDESDEETESVESGMNEEDPNDPEWCEPPSRS